MIITKQVQLTYSSGNTLIFGCNEVHIYAENFSKFWQCRFTFCKNKKVDS